LAHSPRASPLGVEPPMGTLHDRSKHHPLARRRRPRPRICLRKGCGRKYQPRRWNQRYCQEPECQREIRRWLAARRQARHRQAAAAKARHAQDQRARRQRAKAASQPAQKPESPPPRGHAADFFSGPLCARPGCYEPPMTSPRNPARYCGPACRHAVRKVRDRERKWLARGTLVGRKKRAYEYQAARHRRRARPGNASAKAPSRAPPA